MLIAGFILLIYSGKYLVRAGVSIAERLHLPELLIGLTIVALGTSAPELLVSVNAVITGHPDIAVYNVIGSNISNIALVLAIAALVLPVTVQPASISFNWTAMMGASLLFYLLILDSKLTLPEGILFILLISAFIYISFRRSRGQRAEAKAAAGLIHTGWSVPLSLGVVVLSSAGLAFGAELLVENAAGIARGFGISERMISVSLVAVGTSVPEMATSVIASLKKEHGISIGNILGSNIFNIFFVLGISSMVHPVAINPAVLHFDIFWMLGISLMLFVVLFIGKRWLLTRPKAFLLLAAYILYLYFVFMHTEPGMKP